MCAVVLSTCSTKASRLWQPGADNMRLPSCARLFGTHISGPSAQKLNNMWDMDSSNGKRNPGNRDSIHLFRRLREMFSVRYAKISST